VPPRASGLKSVKVGDSHTHTHTKKKKLRVFLRNVAKWTLYDDQISRH